MPPWRDVSKVLAERSWKLGHISAHPLAKAAVALDDAALVAAVLQRSVELDGGPDGSAVAAPMVGLAALEARRVQLGARESGRDILGLQTGAVKTSRGC